MNGDNRINVTHTKSRSKAKFTLVLAEIKDCGMILFHYLYSIVCLFLELLMLLSASRGSDKHITVFACPRVLQIHRKSHFEEFFLHFNDHIMG